MGNFCIRPPVVQSDDQERKKVKNKTNPFSVDYGLNNGGGGVKFSALSDSTGKDIGISYELGQELQISCHIHGLIHQDLNPENFLIVNKTELTALKGFDFGFQYSLNLDNVMKFCTMKDAFGHVAKKQRLSSSKSQEVIDHITRELNELALVKIQSVAVDKEAILSNLSSKLNMMSLLNQIEGQQRDFDAGLSKLVKHF
ncbi:hypothetical protein GIB67_015801 [Kingdonia uniflora]|uniref:Protein kinase domain-containing protein n=1 Tax=Kingdonia uniflora TaxID=39325 RepID=A0A7J7NUL1_9MAGN|nr:hypothetical protein GIB67_015801 [Kingdonia uniflora]